MQYLIGQSLIWLLSAGFIGFIVGYLFRDVNCKRDLIKLRNSTRATRKKYFIAKDKIKILEKKLKELELKEQNKASSKTTPKIKKEPVKVETNDKGRPKIIEEAKQNPDNLKKIKGIGPAIEKSLNKTGVYTYQQIADFTEQNITWVDQHIAVPGRIKRDQWIEQSQNLVKKQKS
jgi:predicted flap endonuclease-1-like 5' DNA nuclease